ncbi:unnamed protein product [Periconia digitata]|uniref:Heterokaryon incompatibility domain-containing protein n=1 Tax=Periconia digitata TaxID=1303443 RepID=A0A9W4UVZ1_9PLEO|nr:unnamed protein product [Periconia digitata]
MLCQRCITSLQLAFANLSPSTHDPNADESGVEHHGSFDELHTSVLRGCLVCRAFWNSMLQTFVLLAAMDHVGYKKDFTNTGKASSDIAENIALESSLLKQHDMMTSPIILRLSWGRNTESGRIVFGTEDFSNPNYHNCRFFLEPLAEGHRISKNGVLDHWTPTLWNHWLHTCLSSHKTCRAPDNTSQSFTPDRLVKINSKNNGASFQWSIALRKDIGDVPYLSLSHCWGSSGHTSLTTENYTRFLEPSEASELPKTFQHAIKVCFSLGFQYIWIDSICIIQDSLQDWETQASMMGSVYANSRCNIAAASASNGNDGCFPSDEDRMPTVSLGSRNPNVYSITPYYTYDSEVRNAPLNNRGWVTQERYLSRRQILFATSQVYWECKELVASEHLPMYDPSYAVDREAALSEKPDWTAKTTEKHRESWNDLIRYSSKCKFSRNSDKLIAIAGLAEQMRSAIQDKYIAGMWEKDLVKQLLWEVTAIGPRSRASTYLGPTWSWVSIDAAVNPALWYHYDMAWSPTIEVIHVKAPSTHASGLHSFKNCRLVLRGLAFWACLTNNTETMERRYAYCQAEMNFHNEEPTKHHDGPHDPSQQFSPLITWDEKFVENEVTPEEWQAFQKERNSTHLLLIVTLRGVYGVHGILLRRQIDSCGKDQYVRAGVLWVNRERFYGFLCDKIGLPYDDHIGESFSLDDPKLAKFVHTITMV